MRYSSAVAHGTKTIANAIQLRVCSDTAKNTSIKPVYDGWRTTEKIPPVWRACLSRIATLALNQRPSVTMAVDRIVSASASSTSATSRTQGAPPNIVASCVSLYQMPVEVATTITNHKMRNDPRSRTSPPPLRVRVKIRTAISPATHAQYKICHSIDRVIASLSQRYTAAWLDLVPATDAPSPRFKPVNTMVERIVSMPNASRPL